MKKELHYLSYYNQNLNALARLCKVMNGYN
jgi:hypothetical protein